MLCQFKIACCNIIFLLYFGLYGGAWFLHFQSLHISCILTRNHQKFENTTQWTQPWFKEM